MNIKLYKPEEDLFQLAANLALKVTKNHPFQDGNKKTAYLAADMFLKINGLKLSPNLTDNDTLTDRIAKAQVAIITNDMSTEALAQFYESIARRVDTRNREIESFREERSNTS